MGTDEDNQILSAARANEVFVYLRDKGIEASRLTVSAHGEMQPVVPTDDGVAEARNRRVELTVFDVTSTELPSFATPFGPEVEDNDIEIPIPESLEQRILDGVEQLVDFAASIDDAAAMLPIVGKSLGEILDLHGTLKTKLQNPTVHYFATDTTPTLNEYFAALESSGPQMLTLDDATALYKPIKTRLDTIEPLLQFDLDLRAMIQDLAIDLDPGLGPAPWRHRPCSTWSGRCRSASALI